MEGGGGMMEGGGGMMEGGGGGGMHTEVER